MARTSETVHESSWTLANSDETVYVAVEKDVDKSIVTVTWAINNFRGKKFCFFHVHQLAKVIALIGGNSPGSGLEEHEVRTIRELDRKMTEKILDDYIFVCGQVGMYAEKLHVEMDDIGEGIVELVYQHSIKKLVIGAAADKHYSEGMKNIKSKKAMYVLDNVPPSCQIWFICSGNLIRSGKGGLDGAADEDRYASLQSISFSDSGTSAADEDGSHPSTSASGSSNLRSCDESDSEPEVLDLPRFLELEHLSSSHELEGSSDDQLLDQLQLAQEEAGKWRREAYEEANRREKAEKAVIEATRKVRALEGSYIEELRRRKEIEEVFAKEKEKVENMKKQWDEERLIAQDQRVLMENQVSNYKCRMKELNEERLTVIEATRKVRALEGSYIEELRRRKEIEEVFAKEKEKIENMKKQWDEERLIALDQRVLLENQVSNYECTMKELDEERLIAMDQRVLLESQVSNYEYRMKELDEERLIALDQRVLLESQVSSSSSIINTQQFFSVFSLSEIREATSSFDPSLLIWEHGYGTMYKGLLRYTPVAIKMLNPGGTSVFQEEVDVLSKFRHPNLITLIGVCPEEYGLIYEYLPNGSLRDRLSCTDDTPPLSWQTRICIATELCSALIFLHSSNPHSIVHGDLKAENIFLDAGFVSKLSGFGISNHPEFLETGELSPKSDIYSFGIIILQLLTGRSRANIVERMREILDMGNLNALLDSSAGDWPIEQAQQVAHLALRCCDSDPSNRPDLVSEVWRVLKPLSASGGASSSFRMDSEEDRMTDSEGDSQSPSYFICPISHDVMQEPVVAADGYTYEEEALREWLDGGHDTSPMTNLRLLHTNLVPNRALRSAIQEWLQHPS